MALRSLRLRRRKPLPRRRRRSLKRRPITVVVVVVVIAKVLEVEVEVEAVVVVMPMSAANAEIAATRDERRGDHSILCPSPLLRPIPLPPLRVLLNAVIWVVISCTSCYFQHILTQKHPSCLRRFLFLFFPPLDPSMFFLCISLLKPSHQSLRNASQMLQYECDSLAYQRKSQILRSYVI